MNRRLLGVNIDHIATIRQARGTRYPDPIYAAMIAEESGADIITLHLREDRRHIQERDVEILSQTIQTRVNLEMAVTDEMVDIALRLAPADCCLVPERREELTTEGGLDVVGHIDPITSACQRLTANDTCVSLFIDPDNSQIDAAYEAGARVIEIHTGHYADAASDQIADSEFEKIKSAVDYAAQKGIKVNAGHGLNYHNVARIAEIDSIAELNIGHAIIARALFCGLNNAIKEMKQLILVRNKQ
ncbi:pyridoxine 5'-phosphate synthase [Solemya pervernicosa gill symbiont]|uniref:Pyridoxine 5'-phosphate synthase n=2 Tax=Gammaproteobacteria incertae sedis TaxID=118884 RepID=A0A1T2LAB6_9GAMM|nr:pyridoxine 5'-phosphate synthase [Candidatus Reidiella endopervernicosa]OOZ42031.1 pyridoxine 5'-phosphate synthase [Solemya pervernicosa gill symbiont]QKQ27027.1 pyridoxine 5'-phosphate synthase [Candidatus Reidiella endopervernicosa]